jgi:hypothetical protein
MGASGCPAATLAAATSAAFCSSPLATAPPSSTRSATAAAAALSLGTGTSFSLRAPTGFSPFLALLACVPPKPLVRSLLGLRMRLIGCGVLEVARRVTLAPSGVFWIHMFSAKSLVTFTRLCCSFHPTLAHTQQLNGSTMQS